MIRKYRQQFIITSVIILLPIVKINDRGGFPIIYFLESHPLKIPPLKMEIKIKNISVKIINTNDGIRIRVYFLP